MSERKTFTLSELQEKVLNAPLLTDSQKLDLMALLNGKKVADLTYNIMAKNIFSPNYDSVSMIGSKKQEKGCFREQPLKLIFELCILD